MYGQFDYWELHGGVLEAVNIRLHRKFVEFMLLILFYIDWPLRCIWGGFICKSAAATRKIHNFYPHIHIIYNWKITSILNINWILRAICEHGKCVLTPLTISLTYIILTHLNLMRSIKSSWFDSISIIIVIVRALKFIWLVHCVFVHQFSIYSIHVQKLKKWKNDFGPILCECVFIVVSYIT